MRTVCHFPWNTLYIEPNGDTYPCCHRRPTVIGNILEQTAREIITGPEAAIVRRDAAAGTLSCFATCNRAPSRRVHNAGRRPYPVSEEPRLQEIHINISTRCNLKCVMCRQDHRSRITLDHRRLIRAVDWSEAPRLIIQGGEPLATPEAYRLSRWVVRHTSSPLTIITNGLGLNGKWRRLLTSGSHECRISLNGASRETHEQVNRGSNWNKVLGRLRRLAARRARLGNGLYLTGRMTVVPANVREMPVFVRFLNEEGYVDRITFGFDKKTMPRWIRRNPDEFKRIYDRFFEEVVQSRVLCDSWRLYLLARNLGLEDRELRFGPKGQLLT